ncbi:SRPBCC family protein [Salinisphaera orenii]|uniref:SRPBCC family protein n=1 Tax=Salinisphaera orenii TaxID=856731 RepID=UPI0013A6525A
MFEFTETITIHRPGSQVWQTLVDIETWWPPSNPEHIDIQVHSAGQPLDVGTRVDFEERVAGIRATAQGSITRWEPEREVAWEGDAVYRYYGIPLYVREGVVWRVESKGQTTDLSANVWARFTSPLFGRVIEWYATKLLNVVEKDRAHARCELEYLKNILDH